MIYYKTTILHSFILSPIESIIARYVDFMEYTKPPITVISTFFNSSCKNWSGSSISDAFRFSTRRLDMDHMF